MTLSHPHPHFPVLLDEVLQFLNPKQGGVYVDATFGRGGYSRALLEATPCQVIGIDRDESAIAYGYEHFKDYIADSSFKTPDRSGSQLILCSGRFSSLKDLITTQGFTHVDGIVFDLGVSSPQLDEAERGFSFTKDGPLDMRMGASRTSARDIVNEAQEEELSAIIYNFGEEKLARRIARSIVEARKLTPIETTLQLVSIIHKVNRPRFNDKIDPATRTFQALRIAVNEELDELKKALLDSEMVLKAGGVLVVVSFHSLEDRIVKVFLNDRSFEQKSKLLPGEKIPAQPSFRLLTKKPVTASEAEIFKNARSRSAKLRAAERTSHPIWRSL